MLVCPVVIVPQRPPLSNATHRRPSPTFSHFPPPPFFFFYPFVRFFSGHPPAQLYRYTCTTDTHTVRIKRDKYKIQNKNDPNFNKDERGWKSQTCDRPIGGPCVYRSRWMNSSRSVLCVVQIVRSLVCVCVLFRFIQQRCPAIGKWHTSDRFQVDKGVRVP